MVKYSFVQFVAALDSKDFDMMEALRVVLTLNFFEKSNYLDSTHDEDCVGSYKDCNLCRIEYLLTQYKEYCLDENTWRKNNLKMKDKIIMNHNTYSAMMAILKFLFEDNKLWEELSRGKISYEDVINEFDKQNSK